MARKVYVEVRTRLIIDLEEGVEVSTVISDMDYSFISQTDNAEIVDSEICDFEITDSK